jgi:hypothetical protein
MEELKKLPPASPVEEPSNHRGNMKGRRKQLQQQQQQPVRYPLISIQIIFTQKVVFCRLLRRKHEI